MVHYLMTLEVRTLNWLSRTAVSPKAQRERTFLNFLAFSVAAHDYRHPLAHGPNSLNLQFQQLDVIHLSLSAAAFIPLEGTFDYAG